MSLFSKPKEKEELFLTFDIGSFSVGGALFYVQDSGIPKIIFSIREQIVLEKEVDFDHFLSAMLKSLEIVVNKVSMKKAGIPKRVFCILSSPWYASQTRNIFFEKDTAFIFSAKFADSLIQKEIALFEEEHLKKYIDTKSKIEPIELKNMSTILNGYATSKPLNQKVKNVEMIIFISMSPEEILKKIEQTIGKHFGGRDIKFSSFAMTVFTVARDMFMHQENFLLVDVGGEITEISMIKKDVLRSSISFPLGINHLIRKMSQELNCTLDEAKSYLSLYKDGHAEDSTQKKLEPIVSKSRADWLLKFQESLVNISNDISIPATIFLTTEKEFADFFTETIKAEQYNQYTLTESKFRIVFLGANTLHGIALFENNVDHDPFLIMESIYINRFLR